LGDELFELDLGGVINFGEGSDQSIHLKGRQLVPVLELGPSLRNTVDDLARVVVAGALIQSGPR
jgi:hypothetical protein